MEEHEQSVSRYDDLYHIVSFAKEQGFEEGFKQGFEEGLEQGIQEVRIRIAKVLRKHDMSIEQIAEIMDITKEQVFVILDND
jgi:predicted transposase/invertase (TIGR01784 family)